MKKTYLWLSLALTLVAPLLFAGLETAGLQPFQETMAYQQYQKRPKSELSKILYLMDRFRKTQLKVIYDRVEYESDEALKHAKSYVAKHYHREKAADWIRDNAYRSHSGSIIYVKFPDGNQRLLRDLLVEELQNINQ